MTEQTETPTREEIQSLTKQFMNDHLRFICDLPFETISDDDSNSSRLLTADNIYSSENSPIPISPELLNKINLYKRIVIAQAIERSLIKNESPDWILDLKFVGIRENIYNCGDGRTRTTIFLSVNNQDKDESLKERKAEAINTAKEQKVLAA